MNRKILPFFENPMLNTFNIYGSLFSIIPIEKCESWTYNHFIQIRYTPAWNVYFFDQHHLLLDNCPFLDSCKIPRSILLGTHSTFSEMIKKSINDGHYLYFYIDRFDLSISHNYKTKHEWHEILVYGYDTETDEIYVADNLQNGKYIGTVCPRAELEAAFNAIQSDNNFYTDVRIIRPEEREYPFRIHYVIDALEHFLDSKPTLDLNYIAEAVFGMKGLETLINQAKNVIEKEEELDLRIYHLMWERAKLMKARLLFMKNNQFLLEFDADLLYDDYESIETAWFVLRNIAYKFNLSRANSIHSKLVQELGKTVDREAQVTKKIIQTLKAFQADQVGAQVH